MTFSPNTLEERLFQKDGGRYWIRTSDPLRVMQVL